MTTEIKKALIAAGATIIVAIIGLFSFSENNKTTYRDIPNNSGFLGDMSNNSGSIGDTYNQNYNYKNVSINLTNFTIAPEESIEEFELALKYTENEDYENAEKYFNLAIDKYQGDSNSSLNDKARVTNYLGVVYAQNEKYNLAQDCFEAAKIIFNETNNEKEILLIECNIINITLIQLIDSSSLKNALVAYEKLYEKALGQLEEYLISKIKQNIELITECLDEEEVNETDSLNAGKDNVNSNIPTANYSEFYDNILDLMRKEDYLTLCDLIVSNIDKEPLQLIPKEGLRILETDNENMTLIIYNSGKVFYYGSTTDGKREGFGAYVGIGIPSDGGPVDLYTYKLNWNNDLPNGDGEYVKYKNGEFRESGFGKYVNGLQNSKWYCKKVNDNYGIINYEYEVANGIPVPISEMHENGYYEYALYEAENITITPTFYPSKSTKLGVIGFNR